MKRILFFLLLLFITAASLHAQTSNTVKVYAYRQSVLSGRAPGGIVNEGAQNVEPQKRSSAGNYLIYVTSTAPVYPAELWINGKQHDVTTEPVTSTPVELEGDNTLTKKTVLVPKTTAKALRLLPQENVSGKNQKKGEALAKKNQLVIVYKLKGKYYCKAVKTITSLAPQVMQ